jgi:hypothetical protein
VGASCTACAEVPVSLSAPAHAPDTVLPGPDTEPSPLTPSVPPPGTDGDVAEPAAKTLRASGVAEVQRHATREGKSVEPSFARTLAALAELGLAVEIVVPAEVGASTVRARAIGDPRTSTGRASGGPCRAGGR